MQKWEYLVVYIQAQELNAAVSTQQIDVHASADHFTETLNRYASGGWELMNFEWVGNEGARAIFKRPRG
jgi:hypothetical protein